MPNTLTHDLPLRLLLPLRAARAFFAGAAVLGSASLAAASQGTPAEGEGTESAPETGDAFSQGTEKAKALLHRLQEDPAGVLEEWFVNDGPHLIGKVIAFVVILAVAKILAGFAGRVCRGALTRSHLDTSELLNTFVQNTVSKLVFFVGLVIALQTIGINIAPLLAGMGVVGFVVGFALQDTLGNFAAGVMLLLYRPFDIGDFVATAGHDGTVEAMTLVSTTLITLDNQRLTIPNGKIWGDVIRNVTANDKRRINETIGIGYGDDIPGAEAVLLEIVNGLEHVMADPAPSLHLMELADSSVNFAVRAWVPTSEYFATCCELRRQVKIRFDEEGISIPFPQQDVHVHGGAELVQA